MATLACSNGRVEGVGAAPLTAAYTSMLHGDRRGPSPASAQACSLDKHCKGIEWQPAGSSCFVCGDVEPVSEAGSELAGDRLQFQVYHKVVNGRPSMLGDGRCDAECKSCGNDGGDCVDGAKEYDDCASMKGGAGSKPFEPSRLASFPTCLTRAAGGMDDKERQARGSQSVSPPLRSRSATCRAATKRRSLCRFSGLGDAREWEQVIFGCCVF